MTQLVDAELCDHGDGTGHYFRSPVGDRCLWVFLLDTVQNLYREIENQF
jgi:hypothetical protein